MCLEITAIGAQGSMHLAAEYSMQCNEFDDE